LTVGLPIFGIGEFTQSEFNEAIKNLKGIVKTLNTHLDKKKFLVGDKLTLADIVVANMLLYMFQLVLDAGFRKAMKNVTAWAESIYALESFTKVTGKVVFCAKALKPQVKEEKKEEKKKAAPTPAPVVKKEKVKDNVESLPPTSFNLYDFKTFFVNH